MASREADAARIFLEAVELHEPSQWAEYVHKAAAGDRVLVERVTALLKGHGQSNPMLDEARLLERRPLLMPGPTPGTTIGPYQLLQQIGEGGMGLVFLAEQTQPVRRRVALKVIKPGMDTQQVIARFEAERQALALMDHPNIAKVFDAGTTASDRPFFVMELVHGVPITEFCDQRRLTTRQRLELFVAVCQAVQHAHQKGIIHRDLKPTNVLVTQQDTVAVPKIIDFGIAKATSQPLTERTLFTNFTQLLGSPLYMSPEQADMNSQDVDTRSDVYSLGAMLYELLTGTVPFSREHLHAAPFAEMLEIIKEVEPARPSTRLRKDEGGRIKDETKRPRRTLTGRFLPFSSFILPDSSFQELDWIVMKCLEKDPGRRYATANELAQDLRRYLAHEPVLAGPPSASYRLLKLLRRHRSSVLAASLVLLALVGGIIGAMWGLLRATDARGVAENEARAKEAALRASQRNEQDARNQLFLALWNQARAGRASRRMGQRLDSLAALARAARLRLDGRLRDEAIAALALPDIRRVPGWRSLSPGTATVAYGGRYRHYARADAQGNISLRSIPDDREIWHIAAGPILGNYLFFSPDERFLLTLGEEYVLRVWRVADGQPALRDNLRDCWSHAFSPDGRQLAIGRHSRILCLDLATGREVRRWRLPARAYALAFHPDNRQLAVGYFDARATSVYDTAKGALLAELPVGAMSDQVVAWHPDGERLAIGGSDPRIQIWNVAAKRLVATLEGHGHQVTTVTFHPDGELVASHGWDGELLLWHPSTGRQLLRLTSVHAPHFSPDGRWLGVAWDGDQADLLEVTPTHEYRTLVNSAGTGRGPYGFYGDISPDGRLLVVGMDEGARVWDLRSGRELAALPAGTPFGFFDTRGGEGGFGRQISPPSALLTSGSAGLLRWPLARDALTGGRLRFGPSRQLSPLPRSWFTRRPDGSTLGVSTEEDGANWILDLATGTVRRKLDKHPRGEVHALSGDGRWAASSGWHSDRVRLWNVDTGRMAHEWVVGKRTFVSFSPDSRSLIISEGNAFTFWDVETFRPIRRLPRKGTPFPGWVAFSPDGRLMAMEMAPAVLHLKAVATGRTVARLEDPDGDRATWQGFTPDGNELVVVASYAKAIHVWNLKAIRSRLKALSLDWD